MRRPVLRALWFTDVQPREVRRHMGLPADPGPQAWVDRLAEELGRRGDIGIDIASPGDTPYEPFMVDNVRYQCVPMPAPESRLRRIMEGWRHRLSAPESLAAADALIRNARPDIVHVHGTESAFGDVASASTTAPCVISLQGLLQQYVRVYFAGRTAGELLHMLTGGEFAKGRGVVHGYLRMRAMASREAELMQRDRWFIGRTDWDRASLTAVNPQAAYFHCDEIMRREFYTTDWSTAEHRGARLYSTSSSMLFKGTETLLEAIAILKRSGLTGLRLRIAGVPPGSEVDHLCRRVAHRHGVDTLVEWLGRLDAGAIAGELEAADAFVYPTHIDNSPNALIEAMLVGVPIAATYAGGIPSLVRHQEEALLVPRGDPAALAATVRRLLEDRVQAARLGAAARSLALHRNDPGQIAARTVEIYRAVIAEWAARHPSALRRHPPGTPAPPG